MAQPTEDILLDRHVFEGGLDDQIADCQLIPVKRGGKSLEPTFQTAFGERGHHSLLARFQGCFVTFDHGHGVAGHEGGDSNAAAHRASANHRNRFDNTRRYAIEVRQSCAGPLGSK